MSKSSKLKILYSDLLTSYGKQGWWPILSKSNFNGFDFTGYHKGNYLIPETREERFEIILGAILTQNTSWKNVQKALSALISKQLISPEKIIQIEENKLAEIIKPTGYYNQKAKKLQNISRWFIENDSKFLKLGNSEKEINEMRNSLLSVKGVGPETADSILLYVYKKPIFVVDVYTKRLFNRLKIYEQKKLNKKEKEYDYIQNMVHRAFKDEKEKLVIFNEFHALIVEQGKQDNKNKK